jgi:SNF2 family DNA or RNA helicase
MLEDASTATLKNVRYPPSSLDMCWRFHDDHDITKLMPHLAEARSFRLLSNAEDEAAPQPPHFQTHPLRPEQLRSLSWMLSQEGIGNSETDPDQHEFVVEWLRWAPVPSLGKKASMEMKARASYMVRGGILADKIGYGKTATTIGLIDSTLHLPSPDIPSIDSDSFIQAKGTLIIVPPNLLGQWLEEITKFLGATGASGSARVRSGMQVFDLPHVHTRGGHPRRLKIFALWNVAPLTSVRATELADADIGICTYRLLFSQIYVHRR